MSAGATRLELSSRAFASITVAMCLGVCAHAYGNADGTVVRVGIYQNAPKIYLDNDNKPAGLFADLLLAIADAENWQLRFVPCTWPQCLSALSGDEIDLMPDVAYTERRSKKYAFHDTPVARSWSLILVRKSSPIRTLPQLDQKRIAVLDASAQVPALRQMMSSHGLEYTVRPYGSYKEAFAAVRDGAADAVVSNRHHADAFGPRYGLRETPIAFDPATLYFATRAGDPLQLLPAIDEHLAAWRYDEQSVYYAAMENAMIPAQETVAPPWVEYLIGGALAALLLIIALSAMLRWQIQRKTTQLMRTANRLNHLLQSSPVVLYQLAMDGGQVRTRWISDNARRLFGFEPKEFIAHDRWRRHLHPEDREAVLSNLSVLPARSHLVQEYRVLDADGAPRFVRDEMQFVRGAAGEPDEIVGSWNDLTASREQAAQLRFLTHYDPLTGLPNRALLHERLTQAIYRARREDRALALLYMDIDRFKTINDGYGQRAGDRVLKAVADRLMHTVDATDLLARIGGDGFVLLIEQDAARQSAVALAQKLMLLFVEPIPLGELTVQLTLSIGISLLPGDAEDEESLLQHAEAALFDAKQAGRNQYRLYSSESTAGTAERLNLERALRGAVERGELALHYQPQIDLASGQVVGVEALVRWQHPQRGLISPARFIPLAEEMGIITDIGAWVLDQACQQLSRWHRKDWQVPRMSVNLSVQQIDAEALIPFLASTLDEARLQPRHLELEVTESMIMREPERAAETLRAIRAMGIKVSIDDFGSGYSSLNYLKHLPIDRLKIDRAFVRDIGTDDNSKTISRAIIGLARSLELEVVAEGIETHEQWEVLRTEGCPVGQGYLFSAPLPADELLQRFRQPPPN